jgi:hypothetical protein
VVDVIERKGKSYIRLIPFDVIWSTFWNSVKKHFFVFEDRKTAIVYFYNDETYQFVGPLYDSGPRFKKDDCIKRYSLFNKEAIVSCLGQLSTKIKCTSQHQFPISPLNVNHNESHRF